MTKYIDPALVKIEAFLKKSGITATAFGRIVLADPMAIHRLRAGREWRNATRTKAFTFIKNWRKS